MTRQDGRWDEVWVYLARDPSGKEWMIYDFENARPLVHADRLAAEMWKSRARETAQMDPLVTIQLVRFTTRVDVETIES